MYPYSFSVPQAASPLPQQSQDPYNVNGLAQEEEAAKQAYFQSLMDTQVPYQQHPDMPGLSKQQGWIAGGLGLISALSGPNGNAPGVVGDYVKQAMGRNTDQWQQAINAQKEQRQAEIDRKKLKAQMAQLDYEDKAREHGQAVTFKHTDLEKQKDRDFQMEKARLASQAKTEAARLLASGKPWAIVQQAMDAKYGPGMWGEEQILANPGLFMGATGHNVLQPANTAQRTTNLKNTEERAQKLFPLLQEQARLKNVNLNLVNSIKWEDYQHFDDTLALKMAMFDLTVAKVQHDWSKDDAERFWKENGSELQSSLKEAESAVPKVESDWRKARAEYRRAQDNLAAIERTFVNQNTKQFDPTMMSDSDRLKYEEVKGALEEKKAEAERLADAYLSSQNDLADRKRNLEAIRARRPEVVIPKLPKVKRGKEGFKPLPLPGDMPTGLDPAAVLPKKLKAMSAADALDRLGL